MADPATTELMTGHTNPLSLFSFRKIVPLMTLIVLAACSTPSENVPEANPTNAPSDQIVIADPSPTTQKRVTTTLTPDAIEGDVEVPEFRYTVLDAAVQFCGSFPEIIAGLAHNESSTTLSQLRIFLRMKNSGDFYIDPATDDEPWSAGSYFGHVLPGERTVFHSFDVREQECEAGRTKISDIDELPFEIELYSDPLPEYEVRIPYRRFEIRSVVEAETESGYVILNVAVVNTGDQIATPFVHWVAYNESGQLIEAHGSVVSPPGDPTGVSYLHPGTTGVTELYLPPGTDHYDVFVLGNFQPNVIATGAEAPPPPEECNWQEGEGLPILAGAQSVRTDGPSTLYGLEGLIDDVIYCYQQAMTARGYQLEPGYEEEYWDSEHLVFTGPNGEFVSIQISISSTLTARTEPSFIFVVMEKYP